MLSRAAALLLALLAATGCDRFADDPRGVVVVVRDAAGTPAPGVEVHAVLHFAPPIDLPSSLPLAYTLRSAEEVTFEAIRKADGVRVKRGVLGYFPPGEHGVGAPDLDLPNGIYRVRIGIYGALLADADVILNRRPTASGRQPPLARTSSRGEVFLRSEDLSIGTSATVPDTGGPRVFTVVDSVTFVFARTGHAPQQRGYRLPPEGLSRLEVVLD